MSMSTLDPGQIIKSVYDAAAEAIKVTGASFTVDFAQTDDAAFTVATDKVAMMGALANEVVPDSVNEGDAGALRMSLNRNVYTQIRDGAASAERGASVTAANALKVDGSAVTQPVSAASLPLPTGASTEATLSTLNGKVTAVNTGAVVVASSALPTGASTEATLSTLNGKVPSNLTVTSTRLLVDGSGVTQPVSGTVAATQSGTWTTNDTGFTASEFIRNDYSSVNVLTSAYVQLIASTAAAYQEIEIFDSSGQTLKIAFGAALSESDKFLVFPGGNGRIKRNVPSGTRISIKAVSATASVGEICVNLYG